MPNKGRAKTSESATRGASFARGGDSLIENDVVYGQPDRDIVSMDEPFDEKAEQLLKPPPLLPDKTSTKANKRRRA